MTAYTLEYKSGRIKPTIGIVSLDWLFGRAATHGETSYVEHIYQDVDTTIEALVNCGAFISSSLEIERQIVANPQSFVNLTEKYSKYIR